jgi:hypothetical protein
VTKSKISFLDLAPVMRPVAISAGFLDVKGLSAHDLAALFVEFPQIAGALSGDGTLNLGALMQAGPDFVAAAIATGAGHPGERGREIAKGLSASDQFKLLKSIAEASMPEGLADFFGPAAAEPDAPVTDEEDPMFADVREATTS